MNKDVTVVMTSYLAHDFTMATLWALLKHYPTIRVIIANGAAPENAQDLYNKLATSNLFGDQVRLINLAGAPTEDCRNAAAALVKTPFILFMDDDTKVLGPDTIEFLMEPFFVYSNCAQSGAYGLVVIDRKKQLGVVSTDFDGMMQLSASPSYFSLHLTEAYRTVEGMPMGRFFYEVPWELWHDARYPLEEKVLWQPGWSGDFTITDEYHKIGCVCVSPARRVPVLHWGQTQRWQGQPRPVEEWWYVNVRHERTEKLGRAVVEAKMKEAGIDGDFESLFEAHPVFAAQSRV